MAGIYTADIFCDDCIENIKDRIAEDYEGAPADAVLPDGTLRGDFDDLEDLKDHLEGMDEWDYDSDQYPKYASEDSESDCPEHCGSGAECLDYSETSDGELYGKFFGNNLTTDGEDYVREAVNADLLAGCTDSPAIELWKPYYDYLDYAEQCAACGEYVDYGGLDCNDECAECCEGSEFADEPQDEDFTITPCGPLGGKSGAGRINGKFIGEFSSDDEAIVAIKQIMEDEQFWPNIWMVSDHGNWEIYNA